MRMGLLGTQPSINGNKKAKDKKYMYEPLSALLNFARFPVSTTMPCGQFFFYQHDYI